MTPISALSAFAAVAVDAAATASPADGGAFAALLADALPPDPPLAPPSPPVAPPSPRVAVAVPAGAMTGAPRGTSTATACPDVRQDADDGDPATDPDRTERSPGLPSPPPPPPPLDPVTPTSPAPVRTDAGDRDDLSGDAPPLGSAAGSPGRGPRAIPSAGRDAVVWSPPPAGVDPRPVSSDDDESGADPSPRAGPRDRAGTDRSAAADAGAVPPDPVAPWAKAPAAVDRERETIPVAAHIRPGPPVIRRGDAPSAERPARVADEACGVDRDADAGDAVAPVATRVSRRVGAVPSQRGSDPSAPAIDEPPTMAPVAAEPPISVGVSGPTGASPDRSVAVRPSPASIASTVTGAPSRTVPPSAPMPATATDEDPGSVEPRPRAPSSAVPADARRPSPPPSPGTAESARPAIGRPSGVAAEPIDLGGSGPGRHDGVAGDRREAPFSGIGGGARIPVKDEPVVRSSENRVVDPNVGRSAATPTSASGTDVPVSVATIPQAPLGPVAPADGHAAADIAPALSLLRALPSAAELAVRSMPATVEMLSAHRQPGRDAPARDRIGDDAGAKAVPQAPVLGIATPAAAVERVDTGSPVVPTRADAGATLAADATVRHVAVARHAAWADGIARDIATSATGGDASFTIASATLGPVRVGVTRGDDGATVTMTASGEAARDILSDALPALVAEASAHGLHVREARVELAGDGSGAASPPAPASQPPAQHSLTDAGYGGGGAGDGAGRQPAGHRRPRERMQAPAPRRAPATRADEGLYA